MTPGQLSDTFSANAPELSVLRMPTDNRMRLGKRGTGLETARKAGQQVLTTISRHYMSVSAVSASALTVVVEN